MRDSFQGLAVAQSSPVMVFVKRDTEVESEVSIIVITLLATTRFVFTEL